jgi:hypothetical protein
MFEYELFTNSVSRVALGSTVLCHWAARWGRLGRLWALRKKGEGENGWVDGGFWPKQLLEKGKSFLFQSFHNM